MRILIPAFSALTLLSLTAAAEGERHVEHMPPGLAHKQTMKLAPAGSSVSALPTQVRKVERTAAKGIEKGADKTAKGVEKGTDKAAKGVNKAADKTAKAADKAAAKTQRGVKKAADKVK